MSGQVICPEICAYYISPAHIPAAPLRPMLNSSKRARGAQRANLKAAKQPRTAPPAQPVRNAVHDGCAPGMLSAHACGAPILTTAVLMFTAMSAVQFWKSAPSIAEEAKAFVDVVSEYSFPPPPPRLTRDAKDFFMMEYCATLQAQGRSYNKMSHVAFQEEVDRMWKVQEESGDTRHGHTWYGHT